MEAIISEAVKHLNLDKSNWSPVKFGEIAIQQKKTVDRDSSSLTKYVKGEHMGSEDIHLREWGELQDEYLGPAFIRYFEEGDILYGSRRTYLKKVVIAPFEGITSNTTFVIKANEKKLDKRLLPFIMLSDGFSEHSIKNSKGSVNPYVNWKDLANYKFLLPPLDQQAELAELLWAMDEVIERERELQESLNFNLKAYLKDNLVKDSKLDKIPLGEIIESLEAGSSVNCHNGGYDPNGKGILKTSAITGENFLASEVKTVLKIQESKLKKNIKANSILFNRKNTQALVGSSKFVENELPNIYCPDLIWQIQIRSEIIFPKLVWYYMSTEQFRSQIESLSNGTNLSMVNISQKKALKVNIPIPSRTKQSQLIHELDRIDNCKSLINSRISDSTSLQKSLINQIF
ncbi:restriction endonuclease subunit S [Litoribacter populi]|uniref:restriction endonuclease subunit S n=1 Tax=Litoribacter populi TaxID=2598460 RepID=UPI00117F8A1F|nr:restriction endonuclease subunit S [Litoribacter populi]